MPFNGTGSTISSATDVFFTNPATGKVLTYNGGTSKWVDGGVAALATGGGVETLNDMGNGSGSRAINLASGNVVRARLTGDTTFTFAGATASTACSFGLYVVQDGTGSRTVTWPGSVKWSGGSAPTVSTAANATDIFVFETIDGGTNWYGSLVGNFS